MSIVYDPLWKTMKTKNISTYRLLQLGFSRAKLHRLKHNLPASTETIGELCAILNCQPADILEFKSDKS